MNFLQYVFYRFLGLIAQLFGALALVFTMLRIIPYDPVVFLLINYRGTSPEEQAALLAELRSSLGIDVPIYVQFFRYMRDLIVEGSLGTSWTSGTPITELIARRLPFTAVTFGLAFLVYTPLAIFLGIVTAQHRGKKLDNFTRISTTATYAVPSYILGLWFILMFAQTDFGLWPRPVPSSLGDILKLSLLPIVVVVLIYTGFQFRLVRAHMLEILREDYIKTARAKGLPERVVIYKHALKNALPFFVTTVAVTFPIAFSGIAALEVVFQIPGIGLLMVGAANTFDWPVLIGVTAVFTILNAIILGITDILIQYFSPKLKFDRRFTHTF